MTAFLWTIVVLYGLGIVINAHHLGARKPEEPSPPGARAVRLVVQIVFVVWALKLLGAL